MNRLFSITIAALGLAAAFGTHSYLTRFIGFWPAVLAAAAIEAAYICLALVKSEDPETVAEIQRTARALVLASIAFNFGHAYEVAVPGGLSASPRFEWLAFVQALIVAAFVPWIAFRNALVKSRLDAPRITLTSSLPLSNGGLSDTPEQPPRPSKVVLPPPPGGPRP